MKKTEVNAMIADLKKAGRVLQVTSWLFEQRQDEKVEVKHVGITLTPEWREILNDHSRLLLTFVYGSRGVWCDVMLANTTPFVRIDSFYLKSHDKIEHLLGDLRRRLKQDKSDVLHHKDQVGNLYKKIAHQIKT